MKYDVAIIIVTYNSERHIRACLASVLSSQTGVRQQIIVLDNASKDQTVHLIRTDFPEITLITPSTNLGFAAGVNEAARNADAEHLLLINPDTVVLEQAVECAVTFCRKLNGSVLVGGRALNPDGTLNPTSCWGAVTLWSLAMFASGLSTMFRRNGLFDPESLGKWERDSIREVGFITGCFLLIPSRIWFRLGGFDERYFMYGEDADLAFRARAAGVRSFVCPGARFEHEGGQSSETSAAKMILLFRGKATLIRVRWRNPARALALLFLRGGVALRAFVSAIEFWRATENDHKWEELWRRRKDWEGGYEMCSSARTRGYRCQAANS